MLRFAVYDWDSSEVTDDTKGQDNLGTMECSLAEIVKQSGKRVRDQRVGLVGQLGRALGPGRGARGAPIADFLSGGGS